MSTLDLAALEAAIAGLSPAPWEANLDCFDMEDEGIVATVIGEGYDGAFFTIGTDLTMKPGEWTQQAADEQWAQAKESQALRDARGIVALRNAAPHLLSRIRELEAEAAETDKVLADAVAKWEEMERCAYNICAHCKEPFERGDAMSLHAQECPRNPVTMLNRAQAERIAALEAALGEALDNWDGLWTSENNDPVPDVSVRLRGLLSGSKGVAGGE